MSPLLLLAAGLLMLGALSLMSLQSRRRARGAGLGLLRRLAALENAPEPDALPAELLPEIGGSLPRRVSVTLARADLRARRDVLLLLASLIASGAAVVFTLFGPNAAAGAAATGACLPVLFVMLLAGRRMKRFVAALPGFFDAVRQLMIAGNSLQQALMKAVAGADDDVRRYLRPLERRLANGSPVADSVAWVGERLDSRELFILAVAVRANMRQGGRMAPVLSNIAGILRDQARVTREMSAASAETRWSGVIIGAFPPVGAAWIAFANPASLRFFLDTPTGHHLLIVSFALEVLGILVMRRVMRVAL